MKFGLTRGEQSLNRAKKEDWMELVYALIVLGVVLVWFVHSFVEPYIPLHPKLTEAAQEANYCQMFEQGMKVEGASTSEVTQYCNSI